MTDRKLSGTVLLADDDVGMRDTVGRYLRIVGLRVVSAETGHQALREGRDRTFDAGLIDYHLPDMDGIECLRRLIGQGSARPTRLLLFTADWSVEERRKELDALGIGMVSKLCDLEEIYAVVRSALAS